jgi:glutathione S-transferase
VIELETTRVNRTADVLERAVAAGAYAGAISASHIVLGCTLGWIDPRHPVWHWRDERPALAAWFNAIAARPSFEQTVPPPL